MPAARCSSTESARFSLNCTVRLPSPRAFLLAAWWESAKTDRQSIRAKAKANTFCTCFGWQILIVHRRILYLLLLVFHHPLTLSLIGLNLSFFCKSSPPQPFLFSFRIHCMDFPDCLLLGLLLSISVFLLFSFFSFFYIF